VLELVHSGETIRETQWLPRGRAILRREGLTVKAQARDTVPEASDAAVKASDSAVCVP
jgi:hypothetical protein